MPATINVPTKNLGVLSVPTVWRGEHLAVHRFITKDGSPSKEPRHWTISHTHTGLAACGSFDGSKQRAVALAKLWDAAFSYVTEAGNAHGWPLAKAWQRDLQIAQWESFREPNGPNGPTLETAQTYGDLQTAVYRAMGYEPVAEPEASEQYPVDVTTKKTGSGAVRINPDSGEREYWWLPQGGNYPFGEAMSLAGWYPVPCLADVEAWCLGSTAETPCGDTVEPDHPDAWPSLLGLI